MYYLLMQFLSIKIKLAVWLGDSIVIFLSALKRVPERNDIKNTYFGE